MMNVLNGNGKIINRSRNHDQDEGQNFSAFAMLSTALNNEPRSYEEAIRSSEREQWTNAMNEEYKSLRNHQVWTLCELPSNKKAVNCKWIYKIKKKACGKIERYKARLVACGYNQKPGIDYFETYSPVANFSVIRCIIAMAVEKRWRLDQLDVETAYLNGELEEEVYMKQPKGYVEEGKEKFVCKLKKSLYGLKQSGRCWYNKLNEKLISKGFEKCESEPCVYRLRWMNKTVILSVYVDDIVLASEDDVIREEAKRLLKECFIVKDLGELHHLLGIEIEQRDGKLHMHQKNYIEKLLEKFNMKDCNPVKTPMEVDGPRQLSNFNNEAQEIELPYREIIGSLMFIAQNTRPDISYTVGILSQYNDKYQEKHFTAAKRVLRYLKGSSGLGILYETTGEQLKVMTDSDWATCPEGRKSISGYLSIMAGGPIAWKSVKQKTVALSTAEAEYMSLATGAKETLWLTRFLQEILCGAWVENPMMIYCDSNSAIQLARNDVVKGRSKHIDIRLHFIRDLIKEKILQVSYVKTEDNLADILTKPLPAPRHSLLTNILHKL